MFVYIIYGLAIITSAALIGIVIMLREKKSKSGYDPDTQKFHKIDNPRIKKKK